MQEDTISRVTTPVDRLSEELYETLTLEGTLQWNAYAMAVLDYLVAAAPAVREGVLILHKERGFAKSVSSDYAPE